MNLDKEPIGRNLRTQSTPRPRLKPLQHACVDELEHCGEVLRFSTGLAMAALARARTARMFLKSIFDCYNRGRTFNP